MDEKQTTELQSYSPHGLISQALAQGVPIETLERLMSLQEKWQANKAKTAYLLAMSKFQSECPVFKKNKKVAFPSKTGGNVNYNYTELGSIKRQIQPLMDKYGLSIKFEFEDIGEKIKCDCIVSHIEGHSERSSMTADKDTSGNKNSIQSIGSTRTYLQRYTLIGALGLSTAEDDTDGHGAASKKEAIPEPKAKTDPIIEKINACKTRKELDALWPTLTDKQQPNYIGNFQTKAETFKKK